MVPLDLLDTGLPETFNLSKTNICEAQCNEVCLYVKGPDRARKQERLCWLASNNLLGWTGLDWSFKKIK
jgi:hypothetical protein